MEIHTEYQYSELNVKNNHKKREKEDKKMVKKENYWEEYEKFYTKLRNEIFNYDILKKINNFWMDWQLRHLTSYLPEIIYYNLPEKIRTEQIEPLYLIWDLKEKKQPKWDKILTEIDIEEWICNLYNELDDDLKEAIREINENDSNLYLDDEIKEVNVGSIMPFIERKYYKEEDPDKLFDYNPYELYLLFYKFYPNKWREIVKKDNEEGLYSFMPEDWEPVENEDLGGFSDIHIDYGIHDPDIRQMIIYLVRRK